MLTAQKTPKKIGLTMQRSKLCFVVLLFKYVLGININMDDTSALIPIVKNYAKIYQI